VSYLSVDLSLWTWSDVVVLDPQVQRGLAPEAISVDAFRRQQLHSHVRDATLYIPVRGPFLNPLCFGLLKTHATVGPRLPPPLFVFMMIFRYYRLIACSSFDRRYLLDCVSHYDVLVSSRMGDPRSVSVTYQLVSMKSMSKSKVRRNVS
jgi:hypothetical protein